jgi:hypothetical protein
MCMCAPPVKRHERMAWPLIRDRTHESRHDLEINVRELAVGLASYVPPLSRRVARRSGGTSSARYCYAVWLRHLVLAHRNGLATDLGAVAELGPGDSLGVGLAALLSGATTYYALDTVPYSTPDGTRAVFDALVALFDRRAPIPDADEFPRIRPRLDSYEFPAHILTDTRLRASLQPERRAAIRAAIDAMRGAGRAGWAHGTGEVGLAYLAPWHDPAIIAPGSVDLIVSQAVLEYPPDLAATYAAMDAWLTPGGFMSHTIDLSAHGLALHWNGHWAYPDLVWRAVAGRRPYAPNRAPHSAHLALLRRRQYRIVGDLVEYDREGIARTQLAHRFRHLSDADLVTRRVVLQAIKPAHAI